MIDDPFEVVIRVFVGISSSKIIIVLKMSMPRRYHYIIINKGESQSVFKNELYLQGWDVSSKQEYIDSRGINIVL